MTEDEILRRRMHGLYLSRKCGDLMELAHELMGLHCWFHRNVVFSALIRGAELRGWKTSLTKTWVHHALHGVAYEDLPDLLAIHPRSEPLSDFEREVLRYMEDGVYSRAEFRRLFADLYDWQFINWAFSPWGGVFVGLAQRGLVAFRDMTSRDFDLISAEPTRTKDEVLPELLRRYFAVYGPATLADAAWFLGLWKDDAKKLYTLPLDDLNRFEHNKSTYYFYDNTSGMDDIPEITLLSGFDPFIVSYIDRSAVMPPEYKSRVVMKSGICLPTVAINGRIAGIWNIKKNEPTLELFAKQPKRIENAVLESVESICWRAKQYL
ncbi:MAG: crosslink repair DNA glycosylase YcaQ family protein [Oscillospiraceae bacterium]